MRFQTRHSKKNNGAKCSRPVSGLQSSLTAQRCSLALSMKHRLQCKRLPTVSAYGKRFA